MFFLIRFFNDPWDFCAKKANTLLDFVKVSNFFYLKFIKVLRNARQGRQPSNKINPHAASTLEIQPRHTFLHVTLVELLASAVQRLDSAIHRKKQLSREQVLRRPIALTTGWSFIQRITHRLNNWSLVTCSYHCAKRFHFFSFEIAR